MGEQCEFCLTEFTNLKYLQRHQSVIKYCHNYKYVIFTCRKCNFSTRGIKNIDTHIKNCKSTTIPVEDPVYELQKRIKELEEEVQAYKTNLTTLKDSLEKDDELTTRLRLERFKNQIYRHIIEKNTSIRLGDVLVEEEEGVHVYNIQGGNIPVFIHEHIKGEEGLDITQQLPGLRLSAMKEEKKAPEKKTSEKKTSEKKAPEKKTSEKKTSEKKAPEKKTSEKKAPEKKTSEKKAPEKKTSEKKTSEKKTSEKKAPEKKTSEKKAPEKNVQIVTDIPVMEEEKSKRKQTYRSIKSCIKLVSEISDKDLNMNIDLVDAEIRNQMEEFGNLEEVKESFKATFSTLKQSRIYTKILRDLREKRSRIFGRMSISAYQDLVYEHIRTIEDIFRDKNYTTKKSTFIISRGLSPLESRLTAYGNYTESHLEVDEIQRLGTVLDLGSDHEKEHVPFEDAKIRDYFSNYSVVLFSIRQNIRRYLFNRYGFHNVVYLPLPKNTEDDPYSFYVLERVNKDKRYWKMDCRLENLSTSLITDVLPYMVSMFRRLYRDVYGDNEFRSDYASKCQITECDCEQLLQNIIMMGQPKEFCIVLREIVKNKSTYKPTENDKFNLYGDDSLQRKRFQEKEEVDLVEIIKQLFDGISSEEAVDFYRSRTP